MIRFGVAGYPIAFNESRHGSDRSKIFEWVRSLNLDAVELQMTYGPRTKPEKCAEFKRLAESFGIRVSVHAAYYIVLTSDDSEKVSRSLDTLKRTFDLADILGAKEVVLHPGPLYNSDSTVITDRFLNNSSKFTDDIGESEIGLFIETAGKVGQLGSVQEILSIASQVKGIHPCIDFGHVHARTLGTLENPEKIYELVHDLRIFKISNPSKRFHFHYTPIHYGKRGEIKHRSVDDSYPEEDRHSDLFGEYEVGTNSIDGMYHPRPMPVAQALSSLAGDFTVISETHNSQEVGAICLRDLHLASLEVDAKCEHC